jgi:hypothetical protein
LLKEIEDQGDTFYLEPDRATSIPASHIAGGLGHVDVYNLMFRNKHRLLFVVRDITETYTGVVNGSVSLDADRGSSRDGGRGRLIGGEVRVVASQVRTSNIGDLFFIIMNLDLRSQ